MPRVQAETSARPGPELPPRHPGQAMMDAMDALVSQIFPVIYGVCFLLLLWQAFRVMRQGFNAVPRPGDPTAAVRPGDRTGRPTIHPELLDEQGRITREDLLTVRFGDENGEAADRTTPAE